MISNAEAIVDRVAARAELRNAGQYEPVKRPHKRRWHRRSPEAVVVRFRQARKAGNGHE